MSEITIRNSIQASLQGLVSRGIKACRKDDDGHLIFTLTDNSEVDIGKVDGDDGVSITGISTQTTVVSGAPNIITITLSNGTTSTFNIRNGVPGHTPVKGTDYFTAAEISQIETDVRNSITIPTKTSDLTNDSLFISEGGDISDLSNDVGYLTSESDPIFNASPAKTIAYSDINTWNGKYTKPNSGIPKTDLETSVQTSLGKADTALQTETDPTVPSWAKQTNKPSYEANEITYGDSNIGAAIGDIEEEIGNLNEDLSNISDCETIINNVNVEGWTIGSCYATTGYSSTPTYRCYSGFFDNDGGKYYFDDTKYKLIYTYWSTKEQASRTNVGSWITSSPATIERIDIPYIRIQLEKLDRNPITVSDINVYKVVDDTDLIVKKVLSNEAMVASHESMLEQLYDVIINSLSADDEEKGIPSTSTFINFNDSYKHIAVKVRPYEEITITANDNYPCYFCGLRSYIVPDSTRNTCDYSSCSGWTERKTIKKGESLTIMIAEDIKYIVVVSKYQGNDYLPSTFKVYPHKIRWVALGDSITEGYFSPSGDDYSSENPQHRDSALTYVSWVADIKGFTLDNRGVGGSGWLKRGTAEYPKPNAREQIDALSEDFFKDYNLCTIMWGINDWKGNMNLGSLSDGTNPPTESVYGNMRYVIEKIYDSNPSIKLIVITPLNSARSNAANNPISSADNNWALGYTGFAYNLDDLFNAIKTVCEYYQVEMIDETHESVVNRLNITSMMPDEVHPSQEAHRQIGIELAGKIKYNG